MSALFPTFLALTGSLQTGETPIEAPGLPGLDMTRYAMVCMGLVVGILLLGWGFKRVLAGNLRLRAGERSMKVVDVLPLGSKRQLAVVRCYDRTFVLGLGEREVNLVTELDADEDVEGSLPRREAESGHAKPATGAFGGLLESAMSRWGGGAKGGRGGERGGGNPETRPSALAAPVDVAELTPAPPLPHKNKKEGTPRRVDPGGDGTLGGGLFG